jgi:flavin-dependent dehydrogenase
MDVVVIGAGPAGLSAALRAAELGARTVLVTRGEVGGMAANLLDAVGTPLGTVQALLGHSSSEVTRDVYLHSIPADARAAVQKVEDFLIRPKLTQDVEFAKTGSSLIQ